MFNIETKNKIYDLIKNIFLVITICLLVITTIASILFITTNNIVFLTIEIITCIIIISLSLIHDYTSRKIADTFIQDDF